jgi:signal transduction histidine kinase
MTESTGNEKSVASKKPSEPGRACFGLINRFVLRLTPERFLAVLAVLIFLAEACDMLMLDLLPQLPAGWEALLDSTILLLVLSPVYFCFLRPFLMERKRSEEEIRRLSRQLIRAEETTRKSLARDLHDGFGQGLTALQLGIETLRNSLPADQEKLTALCARLSGMTAQLGAQVRSITAELRPVMLDSLGLVPTLRWSARQFRERFPGTRVEVQIMDETERLSPEIEIALYRVCQESLNNVAKHAMARQIRITLIRTRSLLTLAVEDDGKGFDAEHWREAVADHNRYGILGMRERIAELGGSFSIVSSPAEGTTVRAQIPLVTRENG